VSDVVDGLKCSLDVEKSHLPDCFPQLRCGCERDGVYIVWLVDGGVKCWLFGCYIS